MPKVPCRRPGCGELVAAGFCDKCKARGAGKDPRPTAAQRGYGGPWQRARVAYLMKHPLCVDPERRHPQQVRAARQVDHIIPHKDDPVLFWDRNNWQGLCNSCHSYKTATEDGGFGRPVGGRGSNP